MLVVIWQQNCNVLMKNDLFLYSAKFNNFSLKHVLQFLKVKFNASKSEFDEWKDCFQ